MKKLKTINHVLKKKHLEVTFVSCLLMFGIPVLLFFILPFALIKEHTIIGVLIGILFSWVAAWLWWSYRIVKWRIWAFESINKKDWSKLESKAVAQLLTWSIGHKFEKVEFRSKNEDL
ncbi:MAG: ABC-type transport system involved in Fe-S cluster assembly fused permease/ATPase subunit, partial [Paraglaciecola sp.]